MKAKRKSVAEDPDMMKKWDFEKNTIDPASITIYSHEKCYWHCPDCGYTWKTSPFTITNSKTKCPCCGSHNAIRNGINDFLTLVPELQNWVDFKRNIDHGIDVYTLPISSAKKIYWKCPYCGHQWLGTVFRRVRKSADGTYAITACRHCKSDPSSFVFAHENIMRFWNYDKNVGINPKRLVRWDKSTQIWWMCPDCGYEWQATPASRQHSHTCLICKGNHEKAKRYKRIKNAISPRYDFKKNENEKICFGHLTFQSITVVWWKCSECGHEWQSTFKTGFRIKGDDVRFPHCPACGHSPTDKIPQLVTAYPRLAALYSDENERPVTEISMDRKARFKWTCPDCGGIFTSTIDGMINGTTKCPYCSGQKVLPGFNSFAALYPNLLVYWSPDNTIDPDRYKPISGVKAKWICPDCGETYEKSIKYVVNHHGECPYCTGRQIRPGFNSLKARHPDIAKFWSKLNDVDADHILPTVKHRVLWKCSQCGENFEATIANVIQAGTVICPDCRNDDLLVSTYPQFKDDWDTISNCVLGLDIKKVHKRGHQQAWWVCPTCGSHYRMPINQKVDYFERHRDSCPYCKGFSRNKRNFV